MDRAVCVTCYFGWDVELHACPSCGSCNVQIELAPNRHGKDAVFVSYGECGHTSQGIPLRSVSTSAQAEILAIQEWNWPGSVAG